jgi:hypothetical protein
MSIRECSTRALFRGMSRFSLTAGLSAAVLLAACNDSSGPDLEGRAVYAVTADNRLLLFGSENPGTLAREAAITGLGVGERIVAIDFRPADAQLYGLGSDDRIYAINVQTAAATAVGAAAFTPALEGDHFGLDFNPAVDRARTAAAEGAQNLRLNPATGAVVATDADYAYAIGDVNQGTTPNIGGLAYTNSVAGATVTVLYAIDAITGSLTLLSSPNGGALTTVGSLGVATLPSVGFDIDPSDETAYASLTTGVSSSLYTVNLTTGAATLVGGIGVDSEVEGIAVAP